MAIGKDLVTVVVPTFNEEEAIGLVLDETKGGEALSSGQRVAYGLLEKGNGLD